MPPKSDESKPRPPKFPRRRWKPGQVERVEEPERGGGYDRRREQRDAEKEIRDARDTPPDDTDDREAPENP